MDTYGDMVTLLLTFFVMMFASSTMNENKWIRIVASFTGQPVGTILEPIDPLNPTNGFSSSDFIPKTEPRDKAQSTTGNQQNAQVAESFNELYEKLKQYLAEQGQADSGIVIEKDGQTIYVTVPDKVLFDSGSAEIRSDEAKQILKDLGDMFASSWEDVKILRIEGHTDNVPINTAQYKNNRFLSSARADEVAIYLQDNTPLPKDEPGMDKIRTEGMADTVPVVPNNPDGGTPQNRRVQFILESKNTGTEG